MATKPSRWSDTVRKSKLSRRRIERIHREADAELVEMNMQELREAAGKTQAQVAFGGRREDIAVRSLQGRVPARPPSVVPAALHQGARRPVRCGRSREGQAHPSARRLA